MAPVVIGSPRTAGPPPRDVLRLALPSARRGPADEEVGEPAVHDLRVLDVGEMAARVEPAHGGAREALGRLRAVGGGDGGVLAAVGGGDGQVEGGDGAPVGGSSLDEAGGGPARRGRRRRGRTR